jgi:hypothetical protein
VCIVHDEPRDQCTYDHSVDPATVVVLVVEHVSLPLGL